jgi:hypothetical protein
MKEIESVLKMIADGLADPANYELASIGTSIRLAPQKCVALCA